MGGRMGWRDPIASVLTAQNFHKKWSKGEILCFLFSFQKHERINEKLGEGLKAALEDSQAASGPVILHGDSAAFFRKSSTISSWMKQNPKPRT